MAILVFAGVLSVPSAVFAEASWYASLRGGVEFKDGNSDFYDGASRWGIKGSAEASEGLTAVYRFEHKISTADAGQPGGRLAYVGLSGGFGSLTLGQIWSASYNHAGVIRDFPNWYTSSDTSGRVGSALSYAYSTDAFSLQIDAIMDGKMNTGSAIDQIEFGMSVNMGDIGKIAFSHVNVKDQMKMMAGIPEHYRLIRTAAAGDTPAVLGARVIKAKAWAHKQDHTGRYNDDKVWTTGDVPIADGFTNTAPDGSLIFSLSAHCRPAPTIPDECEEVTIFVTQEAESTYVMQDGLGTAANNVMKVAATPGKTVVDEMKRGRKDNHLSAEFSLGAVTAAIGFSNSKMNGDTAKSKTTFVGAKGGIGDTGMSWGATYRQKKDTEGMKTKPWTVGLSKTLGGGAWTYIEHHNDGAQGDKTASTVVGLGVNF